MKLLVFTMLTELNASSRVYCYQYAPHFAANGIEATFCPPSSIRLFRLFEHLRQNRRRLIRGIGYYAYWYLVVLPNRLKDILRAPFYDLVFIQRGMFYHCSPAWLERLIYRLGRKTIYHFDDAIYVRCPRSMQERIRGADWVMTVNEALRNYALQHNEQVVLFEDAIDLRRHPLKDYGSVTDKVVIGWVGNPVGLRYLEVLREPIERVLARYPEVIFRVVSSKDFQFPGGRPHVDNMRWSLEYDPSCTFDIGVMPLLGTKYDLAKGGHKILQYMAYGIPTVCSRTADIFLEDGVNCYTATTPSEWVDRLSLLIANPDLRKEMGLRGRKLIEERFALHVKGPLLVSLLKDIVRSKT